MRLAVTGYQDTFLTGDPQVSYYQKIFTGRASYTSENIRLAFNNNFRFGNSTICTIDNDTCDIITGFYLNFNYENTRSLPQDIAHAFIQKAELIVGGQTIVSLTGEYMALMSDLKDSLRIRESNDTILRRNCTPLSYGTNTNARQFLVELPFFGRGYTNAFPLLALNRHTIEVRITLRERNEVNNLPIPFVFLDLQAIYLSDEHRQYFMGKQLDYIIKQPQLASITLTDLNQIRFKTVIQNPVSELILVVQNDSGTLGVFDYSSGVSENYSSYLNDQVTNWKLFLNGQVYFNLDQMSMRAVQPYEYYGNTPSYKMNLFSIGQTVGPIPSGTVNMSRISSQIFEITLVNNSVSRKARLYAVNFNVFRCQGGLGGTLFV